MLNEKKFKAIYEEFLQSGLSVRDYCLNQHFNEAKFYYWQNKLKEQLPPKKGFVPVVFADGQHHPLNRVSLTNQHQGLSKTAGGGVPAPVTFCEISYPSGVSVKLSGMPDMQMLQSLLLLTSR